jgi:hypothetical protein
MTPSILHQFSMDNPFEKISPSGKSVKLKLKSEGEHEITFVKKPSGITAALTSLVVYIFSFRWLILTQSYRLAEVNKIKSTLSALSTHLNDEIEKRKELKTGFNSTGIDPEKIVKNVKMITEKLYEKANNLSSDEPSVIPNNPNRNYNTPELKNKMDKVEASVHNINQTLSKLEPKILRKKFKTNFFKKIFGSKSPSQKAWEKINSFRDKLKKTNETLEKLDTEDATYFKMKLRSDTLQYTVRQLELESSTYQSDIEEITNKLDPNLGTVNQLDSHDAANNKKTLTIMKPEQKIEKLKELCLGLNADEAQQKHLYDFLIVSQASLLIQERKTNDKNVGPMAEKILKDDLINVPQNSVVSTIKKYPLFIPSVVAGVSGKFLFSLCDGSADTAVSNSAGLISSIATSVLNRGTGATIAAVYATALGWKYLPKVGDKVASFCGKAFGYVFSPFKGKEDAE